MTRQFLNPADPALAALLRSPADQPAALLHAGRHHPRWGFGRKLAHPTTWFRHTADGRSELTAPGSAVPIAFTGNLWHDLRSLLNCPDLPGPWVGYFSYDVARLIEPRKLRSAPASPWPLVELGYCPHLTEFEPLVDAPQIENRQSKIGNPLHRDFTRSQYESTVRRVLDYIAAGDVFQVNLAQRFTTTWVGDPRNLFARLSSISPAWYGAYLELGDGGRAICSTSPELFLRLDRGHVVTRPIKGTRPNVPGAARLSGPHHPDPNCTDLLRSPKDTAELNMIVDLMRNDLGRVCRYGSVRVTDPRTIESHPTVHHGVATIEGDLHPSRDAVDLLKATLPGGSVTGAPKVRAMQIIDELEPIPRGPYCGAIGLISRDSLHLNIAIRTILLERQPPSPGPQHREALGLDGAPTWHASFSVGGGIVADSDPAAEYDETLTKAAALLAALSI